MKIAKLGYMAQFIGKSITAIPVTALTRLKVAMNLMFRAEKAIVDSVIQNFCC
jgi:hypothetical protein